MDNIKCKNAVLGPRYQQTFEHDAEHVIFEFGFDVIDGDVKVLPY